MASFTRKQIENYYEIDWSQCFSQKSLDLLIELTCQSLKLNQTPIAHLKIEKPLVQTHNLGHI